MHLVSPGSVADRQTAQIGAGVNSKVVNDPTLQEQAQANDTVDALDNHSAMADQALRHEKVFKGLANLLVEEIYWQLREQKYAL